MTKFTKAKASLASQARLLVALIELLDAADKAKSFSVVGVAAFRACLKTAEFTLLHHFNSVEKTNDAEREVRAAIELLRPA